MKMDTHTKSFELATNLIRCLKENNFFPADTAKKSSKNLQKVTPETLSQYVILVKDSSSLFDLKDNKEEFFFNSTEMTVKTKDNKKVYKVEEFIALMRDNKILQVQFYPGK